MSQSSKPASPDIPTSNSGSAFITPGPDGNIWFAESNANKIGMITPTGTVMEFAVPVTADKPWGLTVGPDSLWFTSRATKSES